MTFRVTKIAIAIVLSVATASVLGCRRAPQNSGATPDDRLSLIGTMKNRDGSPAVGQVVYFAGIENGRIRTEFKIERGETTGLVNPNSLTDQKGAFKISLDTKNIDLTKEFTLGVLDCPRCFTLSARQLMQNNLPLTFRIIQDKKTLTRNQIDLGSIVLE